MIVADGARARGRSPPGRVRADGAGADVAEEEPELTFDVGALRAQIPALRAGLAHFDGPGGTQMPAPVVAAIAGALESPSRSGAASPRER